MIIKSVRLMPVIRSFVQRRTLAAQTQTQIKPPQMDGESREYSPKIVNLVDEISKLNLIEVSDLNELLRIKLKIKDVPMSFAAMPAGAVTAPKEDEVEESLPKATKSSFRLKLLKFDDAKKVALIKEIKALGDNMNLVQAKKFVESLPQVFRDNIPKEEADKLKEQLEKAGATCEIE